MSKLTYNDMLHMMGKIAFVHAHIEPGYYSDNPRGLYPTYKRELKRRARKEPRPGWVTGFRMLQEGVYHRGDSEDPPYLSFTGNKRVALVAYWPNRKPVYVAMDDLEMNQSGIPYPKGDQFDDFEIFKEEKEWMPSLKREPIDQLS